MIVDCGIGDWGIEEHCFPLGRNFNNESFIITFNLQHPASSIHHQITVAINIE